VVFPASSPFLDWVARTRAESPKCLGAKQGEKSVDQRTCSEAPAIAHRRHSFNAATTLLEKHSAKTSNLRFIPTAEKLMSRHSSTFLPRFNSRRVAARNLRYSRAEIRCYVYLNESRR
jgi:hypothetical protein